MSTNQILMFYAVIIIVLAGIGYWYGQSTGQQNMYAVYGGVAGVVISGALWFLYGKNASY